MNRALTVPSIDLYDDSGRVDLSAVAEYVKEPVTHFTGMVGMSESGLRKNPTSEKAQVAGRRFVRILDKLEHELGGKKIALAWLKTPNAELEERSAFELILDGEFEPVEGLIESIATGQPG